MIKDPIVEEVRKIRHQIRDEHPSPEAYYEHLERVQKKSGKPLVRREPQPAHRKIAS